ncbi:MAG: hypothetical protein J7M29_12740 [Verrucomicrobia bacterium]|nr:hypothetical protein [Verrucomicrobiota bacterium]
MVCWLAWWLYRKHHRCPWPKAGGRRAQFLLGLGVFIAGVWFAFALEQALWKDHAHPWVFGVACAGIVGVASWSQSRLKVRFHRPRNLEPVPAQDLPPDQGVKGLILFVSSPNQPNLKVAPDPDLDHCHAEIRFGKSEAKARLFGKSLADDIQAVSKAAEAAGREVGRTVYFNWQPLLRAVQPHPRLERICLLGSPGDRGSFQWLETCRRFLAPYLPNVSIKSYPHPLDFEDFNALVEAVRDQIILRKWKDLSPTEIVVDITGGQKVASIAGAALTLTFEARIQYVQTNAPYSVILYQLAMEYPPSVHEAP